MQLSDFTNPAFLKFANWWAKNASPSYVNQIPPASVGAAAGQDLGFPPITASPTGTPPNISDFNGILQYLTYWTRYFQAGGAPFSDTTFQAGIGGYPAGAVVSSRLSGGWAQKWINSLDNNLHDPDTPTANNGWTAYPIKLGSVYQVNPSVSASANTGGGAVIINQIVPNGITQALITLVGGGAGGGGTDGVNNTGGGGAGGASVTLVTGLTAVNGAQHFYGQIGAGGQGGAPGANGFDGGGTNIGLYLLSGGGIIQGTWAVSGGHGGTGGGSGGGAWAIGGLGGTGDNGTAHPTVGFTGSAGHDGPYGQINTMPAGSGAPGYLGMGAGKGSTIPSGGTFVTAANGTAPGAGGGGTYTTNRGSGGNGYGGMVIIEWIP